VTRLVLALAGVGLAGLVLWWTQGPGSEETPLDPGRAEPTAPAPGPEVVDGPDGMRTEGRVQVTSPVDLRNYTKVYEGLGSIIGTVEVRPDTLPFPARWELVIEPSRMSVGREHAETRVVEMDGNQRTFEARDLPLGGYRVTARAEGYNATAHEVLLYRLAEAPNAGKMQVHLMMHFRPAGTLVGSVLDAEGLPAEGVPVTVGATTSNERWTATTDISGIWRLPGLVDGRYQVWVGAVTKPLVPKFEVVLQGPETTAPEQRLPVTGSVVLWVTDESGRPLEGARVRGFGPAPIDVVTGFEGRVLVPHLPPGQYHVEVEPGATQHTGRLTFTVAADDEQRLVQVHASL
jgi:hypothetical protein